MKFILLSVTLTVLVCRSKSEYFRKCFLNQKPVSCDDPLYLSVQANSGRKCWLDGKPVSCEDSLYQRVASGDSSAGRICYVEKQPISCDHELFRDVAPGVTPVFGYKQSQNGIECHMNHRPTSCANFIFDKMLGRKSTYPVTVQPTVGATSPYPVSSTYYYTRETSTTAPPVYYPSQETFTTARPMYYPPQEMSTATPPTYPTPRQTSTTVRPYGGDGYPIPVQPIKTCGQRVNTEFRPLITKGENVNLGEFPWHVAIYEIPASYLLICSGSIISPYAILSAAHCFFDDVSQVQREARDYMVAVGKVTQHYSIKDSSVTKNYEIENIIMDAFYGSSTKYLNDIAILQTKIEITFSYRVAPVCLYFTDHIIRSGSKLHVAGWGMDEKDAPSEVLKSASFPYLSTSDCLRTLDEEHRSVLTGDKFCIYHANGSALRQGDSGGGLTYRESSYNSPYYLVGIVSSRSSADESQLSIITNVYNFRAWIRDTVREIHANKNYQGMHNL